MRGALTRPLLGLTVMAALCAGCGSEAAPDTSGPAGEPEATPGCATGDLAVATGPVMSVSSQPFVTVELRNRSGRACEVSGYPRVTATGVGADGRRGPLGVREKRGALFERRDPGVQPVRLEPGEAAVFHVGTATAYDGGVQTITRLLVHLPGAQGMVAVPLHLEASRPPGRKIPLGVTALQREDDTPRGPHADPR